MTRSSNMPNPGEIFPFLYELEEVVISTILFFPQLIVDARELVADESFSVKYYSLYLTALMMNEEGVRITPDAVKKRMNEKLSKEHNRIFENYMVLKNRGEFKDYCFLIQERAEKEKMYYLLQESLAAMKEPGTAAGMASALEAKLSQIGTINGQEAHTIETAALKAIDEGLKNKGKPEISTGVQRLDTITGGILGGKLWYLSGRSGTGKTTAAVQLLKNISFAGTPVCMFSMEMGAAELGAKALSGEAVVGRRAIMRGNFDPLADGLLKGLETLKAAPFHVIDHLNDINLICSKMGEMAKKHGVKAVCIDYLGLIKHRSDDELYEITGRLKYEAMRLDIDIFLIVQMNKDAANRKPNNVNLRYVDVQDADIVLLIYNDVYDDDSPEIPAKYHEVYPVVWEVTKNRTLGTLGQCHLIYDNKFDRFYKTLDDYRVDNEPTPEVSYNPSAGMSQARSQDPDSLPF